MVMLQSPTYASESEGADAVEVGGGVTEAREAEAREAETRAEDLARLPMILPVYAGTYDTVFGGTTCTGNDSVAAVEIAEARISAGMAAKQQRMDRHQLLESLQDLGPPGILASSLSETYLYATEHNLPKALESSLSVPAVLAGFGGALAMAKIARRSKAKSAPTTVGKFIPFVKLMTGLPKNSTVVRSDFFLDRWLVYETNRRPRIRFRAADAKVRGPATPARNLSPETLVGINHRGDALVMHGRHRTIGAAHGDQINTANGGVKGQPGVLDFEYYGGALNEEGIAAKHLHIDYTVRDDTPEEARRRIAARKKGFFFNRKN